MRDEADFIKKHNLYANYPTPEGYTGSELKGMGYKAMGESGLRKYLEESEIDGEEVLDLIALRIGIALVCDLTSKSAAEKLYSFAEEMGDLTPRLNILLDATLIKQKVNGRDDLLHSESTF